MSVVLSEETLLSIGRQQQVGQGNFCSVLPYLWPGAELWLEISKGSERNKDERSIIERSAWNPAEGIRNYWEKPASGQSAIRQEPIVIFYGIGAGVNEALLAKSLYDHFTDLEFFIYDGSPTIAKAGLEELVGQIGEERRGNVHVVLAPFELAWQLVPKIRKSYTPERPIMHVMLGNTIANPQDPLLRSSYLYPLLLSTNCKKGDLVVAGWHTIPDNESGEKWKDKIIQAYDTELFRRFVIKNIREQLGEEPNHDSVKVTADRGGMYWTDGVLINVKYVTKDGKRIPCYRSGKHPLDYIKGILEQAGQNVIHRYSSDGGLAGITISEPAMEDFCMDPRDAAWVNANLTHLARLKGGNTGSQDEELVQLIRELYCNMGYPISAQSLPSTEIRFPFGLPVENDAEEIITLYNKTTLFLRTLAAMLSLPNSWRTCPDCYIPGLKFRRDSGVADYNLFQAVLSSFKESPTGKMIPSERAYAGKL